MDATNVLKEQLEQYGEWLEMRTRELEENYASAVVR